MRFCLAFIAVLAGADLALNHGTATRAVEAIVPALWYEVVTSWDNRN